MGSLGHVVLALAVLAAAEAGFEQQLAPPWFLVFLAPLAYVLARLSERAFLSGRFRLGEWLHRAVVASPIALFALAPAPWSSKLLKSPVSWPPPCTPTAARTAS